MESDSANRVVSGSAGRAADALSLRRYVRARTGLPMGASGSLRSMLRRSLGASSFAGFWRYWNPIWGYYLGRYVFRPSRRLLPRSLALVVTFSVSGALHDLVTSAVRGSAAFLFTPWFFVMSLGLLLGEALRMDLSDRPWILRAATNVAYAGVCLWIARMLSTPVGIQY